MAVTGWSRLVGGGVTCGAGEDRGRSRWGGLLGRVGREGLVLPHGAELPRKPKGTDTPARKCHTVG